MRIIPAIDIIDGKCVRLTKGEYHTQKIYNENPLEVAKAFEDHGIKHLHLVDLDGAKSKHIVNYKVLETLVIKTQLSIDFGGGLKSEQDVQIAFNSGAKQITGGSVAVKQPDVFIRWLKTYGATKVILGADVKGMAIATNGWLETSEMNLFDFVQDYTQQGLQYVICTDISKDGMLEGPAFELYKALLSQVDIRLIASGGIATLDDLPKLATMGCEGVIIGKAIYENKITLKELETFILNQKSTE